MNLPTLDEIDQALARTSILDFTTYTMPEYQTNWHHRVVGDYLDKFAKLEIKRLMIFMPPRYGKSELVSRRLPAFILGKDPDVPIITASYGADLAKRMNRDVQRIIDDPAYKKVFPETKISGRDVKSLSSGSWLRNSDEFEVVEYNGYYRSSGIGGAITGMGMRYGIIDDPVKNRQDANSATVRDGIWDWYSSTFRTRLAPGGGILITLTRWHPDGLEAKLLDLAKSNPKADQWTVVSLPAIFEGGESDYDIRQIGEPLWPSRYSLEELEATKAASESDWNALYQQRPAAHEGSMFKRHWFEIVREVPFNAKRVRWWDRAATANGGDYTAGVLVAKADGVFYIEDVVRGQWSSYERDKIIRQTAEQDAGDYDNTVEQWTEQEPGSSGKDAALSFVRLLVGFPARFRTSTGSKEVRADPFAAQAEAGNVKIKKASWNPVYLNELAMFPNGGNDDQVDSSSGAVNRLSAKREPWEPGNN